MEFEVEAERFEVALAEAHRQEGKSYDWWGLFGFLTPFAIQEKEKWYCSEICCWFAYLVGVLPKRYKKIDPRYASRVLTQAGGVMKEL